MRRLVTRSLLAFLLSMSPAAAGEAISLQQLPKSESIHVRLTSMGSLPHEAYEFDFRRADESIAVAITHIKQRFSPTERSYQDTERRALGTITLSKSEIIGLDRLWEFYRSPQSVGICSIQEITVTQKNGGEVKAKESFSVKQVVTRDKKDLTSLSSLVEKLNP